MTCQIIANKYSNYEYMDGQIKDMKTEIVEFINRLVASFNNKEEGNRGTNRGNINFDFKRTMNDCEETDYKDKGYMEDMKENEQLSCETCESKLKSLDNFKRHDNRLMQGTDTKFKCDFCNEICSDKRKQSFAFQAGPAKNVSIS